MKRKLMIASHSTFAAGIKNAIELIIGKQDFVYTLCAYTEGATEIETPVKEFIISLKEDEEVIIVTDLFGGSVNNEFMKHLSKPNIYLIAGMNLPLIFELIMNFDSDDTEEMICKAVESAREHIRYCNPILQNETTEENF